jgi:hypothetical protein
VQEQTEQRLAGRIMRSSTRPTLNRQIQTAPVFEHYEHSSRRHVMIRSLSGAC